MRLVNLALAVALVAAPALGFSQTVTFEDVPSETAGSFASGGYQFVANGTSAEVYRGQYCGPVCPDNGTTMLISPYGDFGNGPATVTMTRMGGGTFSVFRFDGAGSFNFNSDGWNSPNFIPKYIDVIGYLAGGGTVSQSFAIDKSTNGSGTLNFTNYSLSGFSNLSSIRFSASGSDRADYNGFSLDNISVTAVPEPETYALMLVGLGLIASLVRRRKSQTA